MKKRNKARWISWLLCGALLIGSVPFGGGQEVAAATQQEETVNGSEDIEVTQEPTKEVTQTPEATPESETKEPGDNGQEAVATPVPKATQSPEETVENVGQPQEEIPESPEATEIPKVKENKDDEEDDQVYGLGRPMTEDEIAAQRALRPNLVIQDALDINPGAVNYYTARAAMPTQYDARTYGWVTPVKSQGYDGTCWSFALSSAAETSLIKKGARLNGQTATAANTDLSELHAAYFFSHRTTDPLGNTAGDTNTLVGDTDYRTAGGNNVMQAISYTNWVGAAAESTWPYDNANANRAPSASIAYNHLASLRNAYFINNDKTQIKQAILQNGSVAMSYLDLDEYHDYGKISYSCPTGKGQINHSATIIGWDDNYPKTNFLPSSKVRNNGAWLVKNSWSEQFGKDGYFYISYEDQTITNVVAMEFQSGDTYTYSYQYDGSSGVTAGKIGSGQKVANVYQVKGSGSGKNEILKAVNFGVFDTAVDYSIQVYVNLTNTKKPSSGTPALKTPVTGRTSYSGFYTVDLGQAVNLSRGTYYAIVITLKHAGGVTFATEQSANYGWVRMTAKTAGGQSFVSNGSDWYDLNSEQICARIKGFTVEDAEKPLSTTLSSAASNTYNSIKLSWKKTAGASGYEIYRSTKKNSGFAKIATVGSGTASYKDKKRTFNKTYYYKILAYKNAAANSSVKVKGTYSAVKSAKASVNPPTLKIKSVGSKKLKLSWNKISGASGYVVYRSTSKNGKYTKVATLNGQKKTTYVDGGRKKGKRYYYKIKSYRKVGRKNIYGKYGTPKRSGKVR